MMEFTKINLFDDVIFLARTKKGLCYVGNDLEELQQFANQKRTSLLEVPSENDAYAEQFIAYALGERQQFDVPLDVEGTDLQQQVWKELMTIPFGELRTYSQIAEAIDRPTAVRAVANAIGRNLLLVVIPCHRVIGKNGKLTGFRSGLSLKKKLLAIESITQYKEFER